MTVANESLVQVNRFERLFYTCIIMLKSKDIVGIRLHSKNDISPEYSSGIFYVRVYKEFFNFSKTDL